MVGAGPKATFPNAGFGPYRWVCWVDGDGDGHVSVEHRATFVVIFPLDHVGSFMAVGGPTDWPAREKEKRRNQMRLMLRVKG
jgi:hypothetical protein